MRNENPKEKWLLPTLAVLGLVFSCYFLIIFPSQILEAILKIDFYFLIIPVVILTAYKIFKSQYKSKQHLSIVELKKPSRTEKTIEEIIWRNRYVLQSKKSKIFNGFNAQHEKSLEQWGKEKLKFSMKHIYPCVSEGEIDFNNISKLIEQSINGYSTSNICPPTYGVKNINSQ